MVIRIVTILLLFVVHLHPLCSQAVVPEGFVVEWYSKGWEKPVDLDFDTSGNLYVSEKSGLVWIIKDDVRLEEPLIDISHEVGNWGDQGLLSLVLDPNFESNGYFYLYYVVDKYHLSNSHLPDYNPLRSWYWRPTIARVTRYQVDDTREQADLSTRHILIGQTIDSGVPSLYTSHIGGSLLFGEDGTLLVSTGDGSTWKKPYGGDGPPYHEEYVEEALREGIIRPDEEVGGFRAQLLNNRNGKLLRIDPQTGAGIPSNPYYDPSNPRSAESQVFAMGFRNLFRMQLRKGTGSQNPEDGLPGSVYAVDVGNAHWEELNVIRKGGGNYGWPLFEGTDVMPEFTAYETENKMLNKEEGACAEEGYRFKDMIQSPIQEYPFNDFSNLCAKDESFLSKHTHAMIPPVIGFAHGPAGGGFWVPVYDGKGQLGRLKIGDKRSHVYGASFGMFGQCGIVGGFYEGEIYPVEYQDKLFVADYNQSWIKYIDMDLNDEVVGIGDFFQDTIAITHIEMNPVDGAIYFVDYPTGIKRITYGQNSKPVSKPTADIKYGTSPLQVQFSGTESYDPNGDPITYEWDFGNGELSTEQNPKFTFTSNDARSQTVRLTVTDDNNLSSSETILVSVNNTPPAVDITSFEDGQTYSINGVTFLDLEAEVIDEEHGSGDLQYAWTIFLGHNTHEHSEPTITSPTAEARLLPAGCDGELYYYRIELEVTDPLGLVGRDSKRLIPDCNGAFVQLFSFTALARGSEVLLDWVTIRERGVEEFELQRRGASDDGFTSVSILDATNLPEAVQKYEFIDTSPLLNLNTYRLKMTSDEGEIAYSDEQDVFIIPEDALLIYPNPTTDYIQVLFGSESTQKLIQLYDISGGLLYERQFTDGDVYHATIDVSHFSSGVYIYHLFNGITKKTGKIQIH